ncbi:hypothetical protein [Microbacterium oleivorans]|uniref:Uncharacterized protein n=1 Tax=Microbacterium oleivorans TaxID=273677 RepID=A0A7D5F688_9MICO|nr:hypothetical protein [Microbacterium oleivorans]QLD12827.1 hypothetical protein HW566_14225 [Microbacterium oleivorans]
MRVGVGVERIGERQRVGVGGPEQLEAVEVVKSGIIRSCGDDSTERVADYFERQVETVNCCNAANVWFSRLGAEPDFEAAVGAAARGC